MARGNYETVAFRSYTQEAEGHCHEGEQHRRIAYTSEDPNFAAAAANAFAQSYIETSIELKTDPARQFARWFDEQGKVAAYEP
jgi:hypothetical protein